MFGFARSRPPTPRDRSRSPRGGGENRSPANTSDRPQWCTGNEDVDAWMVQNLEEVVIEDLGIIPVSKRKDIVLNMMLNNRDNPNAWARACIRNFRTAQNEREYALRRKQANGCSPSSQICKSPSSNGTATSFRTSVPVVSTPAIVAAIKMAETNPSHMIENMIKCMDTQSRGKLITMTPKQQLWVGVASYLSTYDDNSLPDNIKSVLSRMLAVQQAEGQPCATKSSSPGSIPSAASKKTISLQLVFVGGELCIGLLSALVAHQKLEKMNPEVSVQILPVMEFSQVDTNVKTHRNLEKANLGLSYDSQFPKTLDELEQTVQSKLPQWKESDTKVVFISFLPFPVNPVSQATPTRKGSLHSESLRPIWLVRNAMNRVTETLGTNMASLVFTPSDFSAGLQEELTAVLGSHIQNMANHRYNDHHPTMHCYALPKGLKVVRSNDPEPWKAEMDGWQVCNSRLSALMASNVRIEPSKVIKLSVTKLFAERDLTDEEAEYLDAFRMHHAVSGENRFMSRDFWFHLYGISEAPIITAINDAYGQCLRWIVGSTGTAMDQGVPGGEACGHSRYCTTCEHVLHRLGRVPHLAVSADVVTSLFQRCISLWSSGSSVDPSVFGLPNTVEDHQCGPDCPHNPRRGQ